MKGQDRAAKALTSPASDAWNRDSDPDRSAGGERPRADAEEHAAAELRRRVRELEAELRALRGVLEVRDEAFRVLVARLVAVETQAYAETQGTPHTSVATLIAERNAAIELANTLQSMKVFRYSKWPRTLYGWLRKVGSGR